RTPPPGLVRWSRKELSAGGCPGHTRTARDLGAAWFWPALHSESPHAPGQHTGGEALETDGQLSMAGDDDLAPAMGHGANDERGGSIGGHDEPRGGRVVGIGMMDTTVVDLTDLGGDEARTDQRHGHAVARQLAVQRLGERAHGELAHRVGRAAGKADVTADAADEHEAPAFPLEV